MPRGVGVRVPLSAQTRQSSLKVSRFFVRPKELVQLVAVWQCCRRWENVQSCYATLEYRLRNGCSNKFGTLPQTIFQTFGFLHIILLALLKPATAVRVPTHSGRSGSTD